MIKALILSFFLITSSAFAGGGGGGRIVFDPTNFAKNTVSAAQAVKAEAQRATSYYLQLQQYQAQIRNLQSIGSGLLSGNVSQTARAIQDLAGYRQALEGLFGSVTDLQRVNDARMRDWAVSGMSWDSYYDRELSRQAQGYRGLDLAQGQERRALDRVQSAYSNARVWQEKIPQTQGTLDSMQLMNTQLNQLVMQIAGLQESFTQQAAWQRAQAQQRLEQDQFTAAMQQREAAELAQQRQQAERDAAAWRGFKW